MIRAGMNVARLNFSHGDFETHRRVIENRRGRRERRRAGASRSWPTSPGPRCGSAISARKDRAEGGDPFTLTTEDIVGDARRVAVSFTRLPQVVKPGDTLSLNDGYIQLEVTRVRGADVECVVKVGGELRSRKGLNLPGIDLGIGAFTERDRECLAFALAHGVDAVSQSFVENATDVRAVREAARALGYEPFLIAKIERARALDRLDEILEGRGRRHGRARRPRRGGADRAHRAHPEGHRAAREPAREAGDHRHPDARVHDDLPAAHAAPRPPTSRTRSSTARTA
jgi:pyruvate kinase